MAVKMVVAVTDRAWFDHLRTAPSLTEVNFWSPSDRPFRALEQGELFLFKLHSPQNFIVGGGIYVYSNILPCSLAWEAFGEANGASSLEQVRRRILQYRPNETDVRRDFSIGCRILTQPFFWDQSLWIPTPQSFSRNIVSFKTYDTSVQEGAWLWNEVQARLDDTAISRKELGDVGQRFGNPVLVRPRLGQGAFRIIVTDAYARRCAVTGEKTLPALDAAHIRPYSEGGEHRAANGILLRRDIHTLFDLGYVTINPDLRFEVSRRIRDEYENGKAYYALQGKEITAPTRPEWNPDKAALEWHYRDRFLGN